MFETIKNWIKERLIWIKSGNGHKHLSPADVKPTDIIRLEWWKFNEGVGTMICVANDVKTKQLLLKAKFLTDNTPTGFFYVEKIFPYKSPAFKNFHWLNQHLLVNIKPDNSEEKIIRLQIDLNAALQEEDYMKADEIQKKINDLTIRKNV